MNEDGDQAVECTLNLDAAGSRTGKRKSEESSDDK